MLLRTETFPVFFIFLEVITESGHWHHDLQFLQLTVLQFLERKNRFREDCSCFLDNANVNRKRYSWQLTVSENEFFVLQITNNR